MNNVEYDMCLTIFDKIINIGKIAFFEIPDGKRCKKCLFLRKYQVTNNPYCQLRSSIGLIHDENGALKNCGLKEE
jgi:hypothetical protein